MSSSCLSVLTSLSGEVSYLALCDRYSGWLSIFTLSKDDSKHVITVLRNYFSCWGIAVNLTTDGASVYVSQEMEDFLARYGVTHRVSSAYYPRGNKRSEVAVKSGKRLVMDNLAPNGSLDSDRFARALLAHRNQTDAVSGLSPAEVIFGRQLRDHLPLQPERFQPRAEWRMEADQREKTFMKRHLLKHEQLSSTSRPLQPLKVGDNVAIQDKTMPGKAGKWTKTGVITDSLGFQSYEVKVDGSNLLTTRHRTHLRKITPFINQQMQADQVFTPSPPITRSHTTTPSQTPHDPLPTDEAPTPVVRPTPTPLQSPPTNPQHATSLLPGLPRPGVPHDYATMAEQAEEQRRRIKASKVNYMTTVQAINVTYPVANSMGEDIAWT